jgi:hypothetical protein
LHPQTCLEIKKGEASSKQEDKEQEGKEKIDHQHAHVISFGKGSRYLSMVGSGLECVCQSV